MHWRIVKDAAPNWAPLEAVIPPKWRGGFMWMGQVIGTHPNHPGRFICIELYKHGITRNYLNLSTDGRAWRYISASDEYQPRSLASEVRFVFDGLENLSATRETAYDAAYIAERNRRLNEAGCLVISGNSPESVAAGVELAFRK